MAETPARIDDDRARQAIEHAEEAIGEPIRIAYKEDGYPESWMVIVRFFVWLVGLVAPGFYERFYQDISNALGNYVLFPSRDEYGDLSNDRTYRVLRHELQHIIDYHRRPVTFMATYLLLPLPVVLSGRAWWEWRGYVQNMIVEHEISDSIRDRTLDFIEAQFTSGTYFWMFPFPETVRSKLESVRRAIESGEVGGYHHKSTLRTPVPPNSES